MRFVFDNEALVCILSCLQNSTFLAINLFLKIYVSHHFCFCLQEVKVGEELEESGENVFVGGKNRWK